jgi:magnesium chelatase subunit I
MKEIVEETSRLARTSPHVNQASGVSVRMSIANHENMVSNAERRTVLAGENRAVARISDLAFIAASARGKLELNMTEESGEEDKLVVRILQEAVKSVFDQYCSPKQFRNVIEFFEGGGTLEVGDRVSTSDILKRIDAVRGFVKQVQSIASEIAPDLATGDQAPQLHASVAEFVLEGLHCHNRLNKKHKTGSALYGL